jgi:hypothetical protein
VLIQRSIVDPKLEWRVSLVKDSGRSRIARFNPKAARAKLMSAIWRRDGKFALGPGVAKEDRAHKEGDLACFTCHLSWTTSCGGCHLPIEANWKTRCTTTRARRRATSRPTTRRWRATRCSSLGKHMTTKGNQIAPVRSTSALVLSSTNLNRERIYIQQPPISGIGFSSQAFAPHFPHTVR